MESSSVPTSSFEDENRLRLFVAEVTDYAIYMLSPEGIISSWNAGAQRFKGYTAQEIIGQHFSRFYTEEDRAIDFPATALRTAVEQGKFEDEGWRVRKDGSRFWASVVIDPVRDETGNLIGFAKITRDITERKKASEALHASEEHFRLLVQGVTDYAIYMLSPGGIITNWNSGAKHIKGFEQDEVIGTHFSRFYIDQDRANGLPMIALTTAATEGRFESEGWRVRKDGSQFWAHVVIDPIKSELGELLGFAKVTRDITERRDAALALQKTRDALFQSQKMEAIGKLTGGVAHDFNNILSVIANGVAILRMMGQSDQKVLDSMERATTRGATLTRQLLTFARQQPLKQEKHDLNSIITSFEAVLRRANRGSVIFNINLAPRLPQVMIDAAQLEAALLNLIVNAQDATPDGGSINLQTEAVELGQNEIDPLPAGAYVKIVVADTGEGMPPETAARALEPFFTTKPIGKGTGLGLSQVYGFVQQANGQVHIDSAVGQGTSISIYLPALAKDPEESYTAKSGSSREKALVVDDQPDVLEMATELFHSLGYEVFSANSGEEALEILKRAPDIEVLFSDVVMPGMSGVDLGKQARASIPNIKIILASGYTGLASVNGSAGLEEFQFVSKPYRMSEVIKKLRLA